MSGCPAKGMPFTGTIYNNRKYNKKMMLDNKIKTSYAYRNFLKENAVSIMKSNYENKTNSNNSSNRCKVVPHGGIVDENGVVGSEGQDNMQLKTADGKEYKTYFDTKPMLETRCNNTVPACQRVVSHDLEADEY
jgi:hypothetical protein